VSIAGVAVARLGFGGLHLTESGRSGPEAKRAAVTVLRRAVDLGVELIDTADSYGPEMAEELIRRALHPYPDAVLVATKGGMVCDGSGRWQADCRPERLRTACEGSLRRLGVERIDLYQLHQVDERVPLVDSVGTLAELQAEGKVAAVGLCNVSLVQLEAARQVVEVASVQNPYHLGFRMFEPVLQACEATSTAFLAWAPLGGGRLAGRASALWTEARRRGVTPAALALGWLLNRSPALAPIPGTGSLSHLQENMAAASMSLTPEDIEALLHLVGAGRTGR
jgi:aryl-alcohol dehydrogenase-like predicted oxidoreductase